MAYTERLQILIESEIDDVSLRGYVQRALNRGEAYHQSRRAIASLNGNRFRGSSDYEISLWNECARLLTNAIIYFNSMILSRLLAHFEGAGDDKKLAVTKQLSPVAWHNINLNGAYSFSFDQNMIDIEVVCGQSPKTGRRTKLMPL
jgi:Tn3 transposase DDE domain